MLKTYELMDRHFGWEQPPKPASERQILDYMLDRALRSQGIVSLDSICHLDAARKAPIRRLIEARMRRGNLVAVSIGGHAKAEHWAEPQTVDAMPASAEALVHILSPFDPLIIQRKRLELFFDYDHRFEAYVPKEKRVLGYFALPVLVGDEIIAAIDLKADRKAAGVADSKLDLGRTRLGQVPQKAGRGRTAPVRTVPARGVTRPTRAGRPLLRTLSIGHDFPNGEGRLYSRMASQSANNAGRTRESTMSKTVVRERHEHARTSGYADRPEAGGDAGYLGRPECDCWPMCSPST